MVPKRANNVGRFPIEFQVANYRDVIKAEEGHLADDKVRRLNVRGWANQGSLLVLSLVSW